FLLIRKNSVGRVFCLIFIELGGIEVRPTVHHKRSRLPGIIRDLKVAVIAAQHQNEPTRIIDDIGEVIEVLELIGIVVDWITASRRVFNPDTVVKIAADAVIGQLSSDTAIFEARQDGVEAANLERSFATRELRSGLGMNIDYSGSPEAKLRRERAGNQRDVVSESRRQLLAEASDTFRQQHVVNAVLQIRVFAAQMQLPE